MAFAIAQCTQSNLLAQKADLEMEMTFLTQELMQLSMQSQAIVEQQSREGQYYMSQHMDEEGSVDISAIEYVNSDAFNKKFDALLAEIQAIEHQLQTRKELLETTQQAMSAQEESWLKLVDKNIQNGFKYGS